MRFFRRGARLLPAVGLAEALQMRPSRNPSAESALNEAGEVVVRVPLPRPRGVWRILPVPDYRSFILDKVGSYIWGLIDGERSVKEIAELLASKYKLTQEEAAASLLKYLQMLSNRGLVLMRPAEKEPPKD
ncbi:MAG: PqqD family protein [Candidatus Caldarchaeales archaeon]|nr:PqqD family protein [Candidatus Caldarchaeales archaeon]